MSADQEARRVANDPSGPGESEGPDYIARSVAAKMQWLQRAISPWARRWLEPGGATPGEKHAQAALTVGNTQRLVGHVQRLVERGTVWRPEAVSLQPAMVDGFAGSIVNRFPDTGAKYALRPAETGAAQAADLVLAGAGEPAPASAQPSGQAFHPFTSLAEFRQAVEAKQRASQGGPAAESSVQRAAVEPPRADQPVQPQVQRAPAEPPKARRLARSLPPGSRPVSRVEEVLPGVEAAPKVETTLQARAKPEAPPAAGVELPRPPVVQRQAAAVQPPPAEEASPAAEAGPLPPAAGRTTPPAEREMPAAQRRPEPGPAAALVEEAVPTAGVEPPHPSASREATPPAVQRQVADTMPAPAQPPQAEEASPATVPPGAELEMPVAQRQPEPGPSSAPAGEPPTPELRPIQRQVVEEAPAQAPTGAKAGLPAVHRQVAEEAPSRPPASADEASGAGLDMSLIQRRGAEAAPIPAQLPQEQAAPRAAEAGPPGQPDMAHVQRQVADEALAPGPAHAGQEPPAPPPAGLDMPLAQRQPVETPVPRKEEAPPAALATPLVQRQEAEQEAEIESPAAPVVEAAPPGRPERPLAQRQPAVTAPPPAQQLGEEKAPPAAEVRPPTPSAIENAVPAGPEMPLVQRQAAEATPGPAQPPRQEEALPAAPEMSQVQPQGVEIGPPVAPVIEAAPPRQGPKMPTVQRQTAVTPPAPAPLQEEGAAPASEAKPLSPSASAETPLAAAPAALQARPELPLVQRLTREEAPQAEVGPAQVQRVSAPGEPAAGLEGEVVARAAPRARLPLVEPPPPSQAEVIRTKPVEQTAILPQARVQARPEGSPEPPALAPSRPVTPPEPRQAAPTSGLPTRSGWTQAAAGELPLPPVLQRSAAPARPASTAWIQRQPEAPAPSQVVTPRSEPWRERVVQRADGATPETPPSTVAPPPQPPAPESAPPNLDSLARQIYPLIKRMLAVERERKWGR